MRDPGDCIWAASNSPGSMKSRRARRVRNQSAPAARFLRSAADARLSARLDGVGLRARRGGRRCHHDQRTLGCCGGRGRGFGGDLLSGVRRQSWADESDRVAAALTTAMVGAAGGLAILGSAAFVGLVGLVTAVLLVALSPPAITWYASGVRATLVAQFSRRLLSANDSGDGGDHSDLFDSAHGLRDVPRSLTDAQLCLAWRTSFTALQRSKGLAHRGRLVAARQGYLDELERRDPSGFRRWLAAGARPASDPSKYVNTRARLPGP